MNDVSASGHVVSLRNQLQSRLDAYHDGIMRRHVPDTVKAEQALRQLGFTVASAKRALRQPGNES